MYYSRRDDKLEYLLHKLEDKILEKEEKPLVVRAKEMSKKFQDLHKKIDESKRKVTEAFHEAAEMEKKELKIQGELIKSIAEAFPKDEYLYISSDDGKVKVSIEGVRKDKVTPKMDSLRNKIIASHVFSSDVTLKKKILALLKEYGVIDENKGLLQEKGGDKR